MDNKYQLQNKIRIITATSLFDGHDAAINIMRRIFQSYGVEVIHMGHNRSVAEIVSCAIQEDAQAIAVTSYQGGHIEFFKYMFDLLNKHKRGNIKIFGGGGGVILPKEIEELHSYGIARIYSPDDGRSMGLLGMIEDVLKQIDQPLKTLFNNTKLCEAFQNDNIFAQLISTVENKLSGAEELIQQCDSIIANKNIPIIGFTGTGGAGKSSLIDEFIKRFLSDNPDIKLGVICVDPSKRKTGGALLGDRIRMNSVYAPNVFMRSLATRNIHQSISATMSEVLKLYRATNFDLIILESSGIGQSDSAIVDHCHIPVYVMTPEYGAPSQLEKIDMLDFAKLVVLNKFDKRGANDALRDVKKQFQRNNNKWDESPDIMPVYPCISSQNNNQGVDQFYVELIKETNQISSKEFHYSQKAKGLNQNQYFLIPGNRHRYLSEISDSIRAYHKNTKEQAEAAGKLYAFRKLKQPLNNVGTAELEIELNSVLSAENLNLLENWNKQLELYKKQHYTYTVRDKEFRIENFTQSLSDLSIPKISVPKFKNWEDILLWSLEENFPGKFPFTAGVFPYKRENEDPTRMFAGEGSPERTNQRFHYLSKNTKANRISTAFDSVSLYGEDPAERPDILGKVGNSGVSVAHLIDMKKLYSGFDLSYELTSVSMTINGPAPAMTAFFLNAAIDQQCELYLIKNGLLKQAQNKIEAFYKSRNLKVPTYNDNIPEANKFLGLNCLGLPSDLLVPSEVYNKIKTETLQRVRGTVQADILKEDQAQNTCIFSIGFSLKLMADTQEYFIQQNIKNFYSVSVSGYHIAEAGANPITQLAFTLANGFTLVEYYLSKGMHIDDFAPNLSFFFSNGVDPEFSVIGRVARKIWAIAMRDKYKANEKSQKLKYHIQTSGRSLHAQEIEFNDIRTSLQAVYAIFDNCNSLHTNAYDEAITTPTEESVRRALAIQQIINYEYGLTKNQNPLQGSFIIEELTDLVEEAVLLEFDLLTERGGVLGAMETNYQRSKIQEESMHYETQKANGTLPIIGVNTFLSSQGSPSILPKEIIRSTEKEKQNQLDSLHSFKKLFEPEAKKQLEQLKQATLNNQNIFEVLMEASKYCTLGQITQCFYEVGGQYRRNM